MLDKKNSICKCIYPQLPSSLEAASLDVQISEGGGFVPEVNLGSSCVHADVADLLLPSPGNGLLYASDVFPDPLNIPGIVLVS
jgi:hypothetical protein